MSVGKRGLIAALLGHGITFKFDFNHQIRSTEPGKLMTSVRPPQSASPRPGSAEVSGPHCLRPGHSFHDFLGVLTQPLWNHGSRTVGATRNHLGIDLGCLVGAHMGNPRQW